MSIVSVLTVQFISLILYFYSKFADIYDEDHFISSLKDYIMVVRNLPDELMESYNSSISAIPSIKVPAWAPARYYMNEVYPVLQDTGYMALNLVSFENWHEKYGICLILG